MQVPQSLEMAFGKEFQSFIANFCFEQKLIPTPDSIESNRFLARSIVPHIVKLSELFNRKALDSAEDSVGKYWGSSSNPAHLRLAYFLYFMPCNLYRTASIWAELSRLGLTWDSKHVRAVEFGAGPAPGLGGVAAAEAYAPVGLPSKISWALIEQDTSILNLGEKWSKAYLKFLNAKNPDWDIRKFARNIDLTRGFLPPTAPKFNLWLMSYYLNELNLPPKKLASILLKNLETHLEEEGIVIIIEPATKVFSRQLLDLRKELLSLRETKKYDWLKVLLPCMGHQSCGALQNEEDWCHEDVSWQRPPYFRVLDKMAGLDRKSLPFSYLVLTKSDRSVEEILPNLKPGKKVSSANNRFRLVSPCHYEGRDLEFFVCGQDGKRRTRYRPRTQDDPCAELNRGDILLGVEIRGDSNSSRIETIKQKVLSK